MKTFRWHTSHGDIDRQGMDTIPCNQCQTLKKEGMVMKTRQQQRNEILYGLRKERKERREWMEERARNGRDADEFIDITVLRDIIWKAMEMKPTVIATHEDWVKISRRGKARKVVWHETEYTKEQKITADTVIYRMANQGYIELKCYDTERNVWKFKVLKTW